MSGRAFCDPDVIVQLHSGQNIICEKVTYDRLSSCLPKSLLALDRVAVISSAGGDIMKRPLLIALFFGATFLQAGPYGLTFVLPPLFASFDGSAVNFGNMLALTAINYPAMA